MKNEFILSIEESLISIKEHGIIVMVNSKNEKLYVKPISHENGFIELKILSMKELGELGITVQESCINEFWDIEVQESEQKTPAQIAQDEAYERAKKAQKIPLNTVEDAEKMKEIAERAKEILERKTPSPEDLKAENEDLRMKLEIIATKELDRRCQILGIPENSELRAKIRENPSILQGYEQRVKEEMLSGGQIPEGSAPLNLQQIYGKMPEQSFEDTKSMVEHLYKNKTPENEAILRQLWSKFASGIKSRDSTELPFPNAQPESSGDTTIKTLEVSVNKPSDPNQESELKKFGIGKKKKVEQ